MLRNVLLRSSRAGPPPSFCYRDYGSLAAIGRKYAVMQMGPLRLTGSPGSRGAPRTSFLIGFRNRLAVVLNWAWNYLTFQRGTRLITGLTGPRMEDMATPTGR